MAEVVLLGTGRALPAPEQENTYMALVGEHHTVLVDCGGSPCRQLLLAGLELDRLDTLILTHFDPDHVYGVPALLMGLWLAGRREPLDIYALADTCELTQAMVALYRPERWPAMFAMRYHVVVPGPGTPLFDGPDFRVTAEPVQHFVPTMGVRVLNRRSGKTLAYSSDTEPCQGVLSLARGANLLLHEAAGETMGHSSAAQAGAAARDAGVARLVLVHYDARETPPDLLEQEARGVYNGFVRAGRDFDRFTW